ncbi:hypothetical protein VTG60DRAFT_6218 [Thermothelomyces hinnuleus]
MPLISGSCMRPRCEGGRPENTAAAAWPPSHRIGRIVDPMTSVRSRLRLRFGRSGLRRRKEQSKGPQTREKSSTPAGRTVKTGLVIEDLGPCHPVPALFRAGSQRAPCASHTHRQAMRQPPTGANHCYWTMSSNLSKLEPHPAIQRHHRRCLWTP